MEGTALIPSKHNNTSPNIVTTLVVEQRPCFSRRSLTISPELRRMRHRVSVVVAKSVEKKAPPRSAEESVKLESMT